MDHLVQLNDDSVDMENSTELSGPENCVGKLKNVQRRRFSQASHNFVFDYSIWRDDHLDNYVLYMHCVWSGEKADWVRLADLMHF